MALLGKSNDDYTRTGKSTLSQWSSKLSYLPFSSGVFGFLSKVPVIGPAISGSITAFLGYAGAIVESFSWLMRGQIGSALTAAAAGIAATTVNTLQTIPGANVAFWWVNDLSGMVTGESLGTHARAGVEGIIRTLGMEPEVLSSHTVGIGSIGGGAAPQQAAPVGGPGYWANRASQERGVDANAAYAKYMSGEGGAHLNQLQSASGRA
jgi:hypothetical protein